MLAAGARGQGPDGTVDGAALVRAITGSLRAIEARACTIAVDASVEVSELAGRVLDPPARARVRYRTRGGRGFIEIEGADLDHVGPAARGPGAHRARLLLPGGVTESVDLRTGGFSRDQRSYLDATTVASDLGPGELLGSFCGTSRAAILEQRAARVAGVTGEPGRRRVEVVADDAAGSQRIVFVCAEELGFLPVTSRMLVARGTSWLELRTIEVRACRRTRLGHVPRSATLTALRPAPGAAVGAERFDRTRAAWELGDPELADVSVPRSIAGLVAETRRSSPDDLAADPSAARAAGLDRQLAAAGAHLAPGFRDGVRRHWWREGLAVAAAAVTAAAGAWRKRKAIVALGAAACAAVAIHAGVRAAASRLPGPAGASEAVLDLATIASEAVEPSRQLCGVDCLYVGAALARVGGADYARLVRLVRPGAHGTALESLRVASECLGLAARPVNPRSFDRAPGPMIGHVDPRHFVVVTGLGGEDVAVVDPSRGVFRGSWERVRSLLSPVALVLGSDDA